MYLSLSWRNIWRSKKRTIIVAASVFFAVILAVMMRSAQLGSYSYMIDSSAKLFTGYLQIQDSLYWEKRSPDQSFIMNAQSYQDITEIDNVTISTRRLEAFALISHQQTTKVAQVIGIDPENESRITRIADNLVAGEFLTDDADGLLVGAGLAEMLAAEVGDSLVIYGQGYHGQIAAAILPIAGIVKLPFKAMDNAMILLPLRLAQTVFSCPERITSIPIIIDDIRHLENIRDAIARILDAKLTVMTWDEMMPDLKQSIEVDNISGIIMLAILYIVIAFGVLGTIMMMVSERAKEFAILISVGMKRMRILLVLAIETFLVSFLGVLAGIGLSIPLVIYLANNPFRITGEAAELYETLNIEPIFAFSQDPTIFTSQALVVMIIALIALIYPVLYIRRLEPSKTIRG